ncbi:MAG: 16S rRNA (guanine(966)-N(2))-methyltransferase RsmD [Coriobacteriia bacterium]|jgi:16S rRNA (guanine966-N2)-methyltransferase|nr:16S rRNA (guanine(966)-N(2))-methyltransferase RsmD [Coriobacteriia bacterium]
MRITGGVLRGRRIKAPGGAVTRPTADRVREAMFSRIEALFEGGIDEACVLDLFAGSGALGAEALSRGASRATFYERDRRAYVTLQENLEALGLEDRATAIHSDPLTRLRSAPPPGGPFSLLFLDPPYRIVKSEVTRAIMRLADAGALSPGAMVIWEHASADEPAWPAASFEGLGSRRYGDTTVSMARYKRGGR